MSAAVIGRQLRQQATSGRTSGPLVPPSVPGKGRPRTPSHAPTSGRPYSPAPASMTGTSGERYNVIPGAGGGGGGPGGTHLAYPSSHPGLHGEKDRNKGEEPKLKCTWHCFCVALKALSGGLVLFVAGTIMSVVGFVADANHNSTQTLSNDTVIETPLPSVFRNLTFAGPVIMGLGGIVIVAALVLTFEVRDTLGVKVVPAKSNPPPAPPPPTTSALTGTNNLPPLNTNKDSFTSKSGEPTVGKKGPVDPRKEPIPSIESTLSPENRITGQSIDGSLLRQSAHQLGHQSTTISSTGAQRLNQTGKEAVKGLSNTLSSPTTKNAYINSSNSNNNDDNNNDIRSSINDNTNIINQPSNPQKPHLSLRNGSSGGHRGKIKLDPSSLTIPFDVLSDLGPVTGSLHRQRLGDINTETTFNGLLPLDDPLIMDTSRPSRVKYEGSQDNKIGLHQSTKYPGYQGQSSSSAVDNHNLLASLSSGTTSLNHVISPNIESFYFALPSPQETELSDPEGCSLKVPARWRSSRCSCSASPTHSMSMELYLDQKEPPINIKIIEQQRIQEQLILQQQILLKQQQDQLQRLIEQANLGSIAPFRRPKVLASIESDGLSSTSSSSDDLFVPLRRSRPSSSTSPFNNQQSYHQHHHHHHQSTSSSAPHYQHQQTPQFKSASSSQRPTKAIYQQSTSSTIDREPIRSSLTKQHHHHKHDDVVDDDDEPLVSASAYGLRSELSSEFSSNASEFDSPLHIDLDEDLSRTLERLRSPVKSTLRSKSSRQQVKSEEESRDDERDTSESTLLLPSSSSMASKASLSPTITLNRPECPNTESTFADKRSTPSEPATTQDKRFPLLREGALSNGSVPNRKR